MRGYFLGLFQENPHWLDETSNRAPLEQWQHDFPHELMTSNIRSSLSNVKSLLRRGDLRLDGRTRKARNGAMPRRLAPSRSRLKSLENLENLIDHCLFLARQQPGEELARVIVHLRLARNSVVIEGAHSAPRGD